MIITPNMIVGGLQVLDMLLGGGTPSQPQQQSAAPASSPLTFRQAMHAARQGTSTGGLQIKIGDTRVRTAGDRELRLRF